MSLDQFHSDLLQLNEEQIIQLIAQNIRELKVLFINLFRKEENTTLLGEILVYLTQLNLSDKAKHSEEIQFLYRELAFYFKRNNDYGHVVNCKNFIDESILKNRLNAWLHYRLYSSVNSHVDRFRVYLQKLSSAISDGTEDYENDVLRDLNDYYVDTVELLRRVGETKVLSDFIGQFQNEELQNEFSILKIYNDNKIQFSTTIAIGGLRDKLFEPSVFTDKLFNSQFLDYIRAHERTNWHKILLGYDTFTIRSKIINFGQTEFDNGYKDLTSSQVVKLYAYFNMRKHYYSSLSLFERFDPIRTLYGSTGIVKFIDIGCGPATSGIALVDYLHSMTNDVVSFDYFGIDLYKSMRDAAKLYMNNSLYRPVSNEVYIQSLSQFNFNWLQNANGIFINTCYLFASTSLDEVELAKSIQNLRRAKPDVPFFILFQNTIDPEKNTKYDSFKSTLVDFDVLLDERSLIKYNNQRNSYWPPTGESVFFQILKLN